MDVDRVIKIILSSLLLNIKIYSVNLVFSETGRVKALGIMNMALLKYRVMLTQSLVLCSTTNP